MFPKYSSGIVKQISGALIRHGGVTASFCTRASSAFSTIDVEPVERLIFLAAAAFGRDRQPQAAVGGGHERRETTTGGEVSDWKADGAASAEPPAK